uniref:Cytochrome P450 n=1 Tax=Globodera pallida TaxID=36090 RepID=A0A183BXD1_GLOPA
MVPIILQFALILLCSVVTFVAVAFKHRKYWLNRGIPSPTPKLISGNFDALFVSRPGIFQFRDWTAQFGKVYGIQYGWRNALVISDPAMVHELLVTKFEYFHGRNLSPIIGNVDSYKWIHMFFARGGRWKRLRTIANPAFSVTNLKKAMLLIDDSVKNAIVFLEEARNGGKAINIHRHFVEMTFDVISRVALGQRDSRQFRTDQPQLAMAAMMRINSTVFDYVAWLFPWFGLHFVHPFVEWSGLLRSDPLAILRKQLLKEVQERKQQRERGQKPQASVDFIDLFLEMESEEQTVQKHNGVFNKSAHSIEKKNTSEEIVMQLESFMLAGFDTTANSLSVVSRNLAFHPEVQAKAQEEIDSICIDEDPTYEQLSQLKYTEAIVKETLRLCPVGASVMNRICSQTTTLGEHTVEEGTVVVVDVLSVHRDKSVWGEDAEQFRPERWLEEGRQLPPAYSFGGGPRVCIGMRLAMIEEKLALIRILRKYSIVPCEATEKELDFCGQIVLTPKAVTVALKLREEQ